MVTTRLSKQQREQISTILHQAALPKAGFVRTVTHAVLYGPHKYQGMGLMHHWCNQELTHLNNFVHQVNLNSSCGKRYQISTEQMRLETGFPGPITAVPYDSMHEAVTDCWMKTLWHSCRQFSIHITEDFGDLQPLWKGISF